MQLFKTLASPVVLLLLCSCGNSETVPARGEQPAPKQVVKYSRSKDVAVRKAVAEASRQQREAGGVKLSPPAGKDPVASAGKPRRRLPQKAGVEAGTGSSQPAAKPAPQPAAKVAAKPAAVEAGAGSGKPVLPQPSPADAARVLLKRLAGPVAMAKKTYVELWGVDKGQIPELIRKVASKEPTQLKELDLLVLQKGFARYDEKEKRWYYWIKGMGNFEIDDLAMSKVPGRKGAVRVRIKKFGGFPLGVVLRAGLLNRFRSTRFPSVNDRKYLSRWWNLFYRLNAPSLK